MDQKPPAITNELASVVKTYIAAKGVLQVIEPIVTGYKRAILAKHQFTVGARWAELRAGSVGHVILDPDLVFLLEEEDAQVVYAEYEAAADEHKLYHEPGKCPLLVAEDNVHQAMTLVLNASQYITGKASDDVRDPDIRRQLVDLIVNHVVVANKITGADVFTHILETP